MSRTTASKLPLLVALTVLAASAWPAGLTAATFTVTSAADAVDSSPGDGVCDDGSGSCTLRAAVMEANALAGADTVHLPAGTYTLTIAGTGEDAAAAGDLDITQDLAITGADRTTTVVDGGALDSVLHVDPAQAGVTVSIADLAIRNGSSGLPWGGGGVLNRGTLALTRCRVADNSGYSGGGILNAGPSLTLEECEITGNVATSGYGGGLGNYTGAFATATDTTVSGNTGTSQGGAGIGNNGTLTVTSCLVQGNSGGPPVTNRSGGVLDIVDTTISGNDGGNYAGGIHNSSSTVTVTASTISGNHGRIGIHNQYSGAVMTLTNCTVSGNYGGMYNGGGVLNEYDAVLDLRNTTIASNQGPTSQYATPTGGGITNTATVNLRNSIVASNSSATGSPDCLGTLTSEGYNLVGSLAGCSVGGDTTGNVSGAARLLPLADNGGTTMTHALGTISPAIDAGNPAAPGSGGTACEPSDQRGVARPLDGDGDAAARCDMGAYETTHAVSTYTVTTTDDTDDGSCDPTHCSLREAILASNATSTGVDTIAFDIPGTGPHTIQPLSALPNIVDPVVVDGYTQPGATPNSNGPGLGSNAVLMVEVDGTSAGSGVSGLKLTYGASTVRGLVVNRFVRSGSTGGHGVELSGYGGNRVEGCFLGTDPGGTLDRGNQRAGVFVYGSSNTVGGTAPAARNVISGNDQYEVLIQGSSNHLLGNLLGTNAAGSAAIGLGGIGVDVIAGSANRIGSSAAGAGNLISGNGTEVEVDGNATGTLIHGNTIGPDVTGTLSLGSGTGVYVTQQASSTAIGGSAPGEGNLVSGLVGPAVQLMDTTTGTVIQGNRIGVAADGTSPLGNGYAVRSFTAGTGNLIGGAVPGEGNVIAFNGAQPPPGTPKGAVVIGSGSGLDIRANRFFDNVALAIDLGNNGVTPNDPGDGDTGPNNLQNYPVLAAVTGGGATVEGSLDSSANTDFRLDFYASPTCDPSGFGEGETFLGSAVVTTDSGGNISFSASPGAVVPVDWFVTATATAPDGSTSELSACLEHEVPYVDLTLLKTDGDAVAVPGTTLAYTLTWGNAGGLAATGVVLTDTVPALTTFDPGASSPGWSCVPDTGAGSVCTLAVGTVTGGGSGSAAFAVTLVNPVAAGVAELSNTASIADDGSGGPDLNPGDNTDTEETPVDAAPDLGIAKDYGGASPLPGDTLVYTLTYANAGTQDATGVELTEVVPGSTTFDSAASSPGWSCVPGTGAGSVCSLAVGALGGGGGSGEAAFAVVLDDPWTPGIVELENTASIADDGANGADPNPDDNSVTVVTGLDAVPPTVTLVGTVPDTGDGRLSPCESVHRLAVTHLLVSFSEAVLDPPGDGEPDDVTNPANYLLVAAGDNLERDTLACGAVTGDDIALPVAAVTYDAGTSTATLDLGGTLGDGVLRLLVCGSTSIRDLYWNPLDGDGDGTGGDDFVLDFRVDLHNLLDNGHLDCSLDGWSIAETIPGAVNHSFEDADGSAQSGSAEVYNPSTTGVPEAFAVTQCVPLALDSGYVLGLRARVDAAPGVTLTLRAQCELFDQAGCLGVTEGLLISTAWLEDTGGTWAPLDAPLSASASSLSAWCSFALSTSAGSAFTGYLDRLELVPSDEVVFVDGFGTGDLSPWSGYEP